MPKKPFTIEVQAPTADQAFAAAQLSKAGKTGFRLVEDTPTQVRAAVGGKLRRVAENPALYGDKIEEYKGILQRFDSRVGKDPHGAVVAAMLEHGDLRVDNATSCGIRRIGAGQWVVFGNTIGR